MSSFVGPAMWKNSELLPEVCENLALSSFGCSFVGGMVQCLF